MPNGLKSFDDKFVKKIYYHRARSENRGGGRLSISSETTNDLNDHNDTTTEAPFFNRVKPSVVSVIWSWCRY